MEGNDLIADLDAFLAGHEAELVEFRRDLHAHPELAYTERRTTRQVALRLTEAGLRPVSLPKGTGLLVDIDPYSPGGPGGSAGPGQNRYPERPVVALRRGSVSEIVPCSISNRPSGLPLLDCSDRAASSWASVRSPSSMSNAPSGVPSDTRPS